jgi:rubrerythrin
MDELLKIDSSFNEGMFITKVNNIFVLLYTSIMMGNLDKVRHFLSSGLEEKYDTMLKEYAKSNVAQMYDELNVKSTEIKKINILDDKIEISVDLVSRYMDYIIDRETSKFISGVNDHRVEKMNHLIFIKKIGASYNEIAQSCPGCGANINVNANGKCPYCGTIFNAEDYEWILTSIETIDV